MQLIYDGYKELCLFHLNNLKVEWLDILEGNIVPFPTDYLYYSRIAVIVGRSVFTLTKDDNIPLPREYSCGEESNSVNLTYNDVASDEVSNEVLPYVNYNMGYFADTGQNVGYYRLDEQRRMIVLKGSFPAGKILLEYATIPITLGEKTLIPQYVVSSLVAYVMYKTVQYDTRIHRTEKEMRHQAYIAEVTKLRMIVNQMTADEWMDIVNVAKTQSPKR
jgi:hypothetical protein